MKKLCILIAVCLCIVMSVHAQNYYWIGPSNGNWNSNANWSNSPGGSAAADYPHLSTHNVFFENNAIISLNDGIDLNRLSVSGSGTHVKIVATGGSGLQRSITVHSSDALNPALSIAAGSRLESDAAASTSFLVNFEADAIGQVNGDWYFTGDINNDALAAFFLGLPGASTRLNINTGGSITISANGYTEPNTDTGDEYLVFHAGGSLNLLANGPIVPAADYNANSIINISGVIDASVIFEETGSVGNIIYNSPSQVNGPFPVYLVTVPGLIIKGDLSVLHTNNEWLTVLSDLATDGLPSRSAVIQGDLNIQGNSKVSVANGGYDLPNHLTVAGNVIANGTGLSLQSGSAVTGQPTVLFVQGNIQHTAGTFTSSAAKINETTDLYVVEMNGSAAQTISSHSGSFDNAGHQVTLRINNTAGVTLLTSLEVGRLSFNTVNQGVLSTGSNVITLNNTTPSSVSSIVLNMPAGAGTSYVNGTIRRKTASTDPLLLATGGGGFTRSVTLIPSSAAATVFEAKFVDSKHAGTYTPPIRGIADYYWDISRIGAGADAMVQFSLPGAIPGAQSGHELVVARYDGSNWINTKGFSGIGITPGNATSGTVRSETQTDFGFLTIGFASEVALPTTLVSFTAKRTGKETAALKWKITDNSTPASFEVLRAADGVNFTAAGTVRGIEGIREYEFTDHSLKKGNNFYRLRMLDRDGAVTYSAIVVVSNGAEGVAIHSMMPTVVQGMGRLSISAAQKMRMQLVVSDMNGRVVQTQNIGLNAGTQDVWLNASSLAAGMYQVTGFTSGEKTSAIRFIKQ